MRHSDCVVCPATIKKNRRLRVHCRLRRDSAGPAGRPYLGDRNIGQNGEIFCGAVLPEGFERSGFEAFKEPKGSAIGHVLGYSTYTPGTTFTYWFGSGWSKAGIKDLGEWVKLISSNTCIL